MGLNSAAAAPDREIPDELAGICLAALVKDPGQRIVDVAAFAKQVRDYRHHAQAVALVTAVRAHLQAAVAQPRMAAVHLRKAVSGAEQALDIWPGWLLAKTVLLQAVLADARGHLAAGAATLAGTEANRAAALAQQNRLQQVRWARRGALAAGILLILGLSGFALILRQQQQHTADALAKAESALAALSAEQTGRSGDQKTSAPALVIQARKALTLKDWDAAITSLATALTFDGTLLEAHQLHANALAVARRYEEAIASCQRWQEVAGGASGSAEHAQLATTLAGICRILQGKSDVGTTTETQVRLTDLFERQKFYPLAEATAIAPARRLALYRTCIEDAWPGRGAGLSMRQDGRLVADAFTGNDIFVNRRDVTDLEPIRGMPFAVLNLNGSGIKDLAALAGMPLEKLYCSGTAVSDLSPLRGMRLQSVSFSDTKVTDLSPLAGMPLTYLWAYNLKLQSRDLSWLRGMPLVDLHLGGCEFSDLAPLAGAPLRTVSLRTSGSIDLAGLPSTLESLTLNAPSKVTPGDLARFQVKHVRLIGYERDAIVDLRQLDASRLESLTIDHVGRLDLSALVAPRLTYVGCYWSGDVDLSALVASPLREIRIEGPSPVTWQSLKPFRQSQTLTTIVLGRAKMPVAEFWVGYREDIAGLMVKAITAPPAPAAPATRAPGLAWAAMKGIKTTVDALAAAPVIETGTCEGIGLEQPDAGLMDLGFAVAPQRQFLVRISGFGGCRGRTPAVGASGRRTQGVLEW